MEEPYLTIFGTFLGALLGVLTGVIGEHAWDYRVTRSKRRDLVMLLQRTVEVNLEIVREVGRRTANINTVSFLNVDTTLLDSTGSLKYELLAPATCSKIETSRYLLTCFHNLVSAIQKLDIDPSSRLVKYRDESGAAPATHHERCRTALMGTVSEHVQALEASLSDLQVVIEAESKRLNHWVWGATKVDGIKTIADRPPA